MNELGALLLFKTKYALYQTFLRIYARSVFAIARCNASA